MGRKRSRISCNLVARGGAVYTPSSAPMCALQSVHTQLPLSVPEPLPSVPRFAKPVPPSSEVAYPDVLLSACGASTSAHCMLTSLSSSSAPSLRGKCTKEVSVSMRGALVLSKISPPPAEMASFTPRGIADWATDAEDEEEGILILVSVKLPSMLPVASLEVDKRFQLPNESGLAFVELAVPIRLLTISIGREGTGTSGVGDIAVVVGLRLHSAFRVAGAAEAAAAACFDGAKSRA
mmetsp:Transcript_13718/g.35212  ORF Transcript_13718/g.35212 Transcript_13718/m.35212 type:complete len:236 (+) Transcript_13718:151-858(+)